MVTITYKEDPIDKVVTLQVRGHSGKSPIGHDIVCSAISILTYTVAQIFTAMDRGGDFQRPAVIMLDSGNAYISAVCRDGDIYGEAVRVMLYAITGYRLLEATYPEFIQFGEDS